MIQSYLRNPLLFILADVTGKRKTTMRLLLTIILSNIFLTTFGQTDNRVTERIIYTVRLDDNSQKENGLYSHLDTVTKKSLINQLCDLVYNKKLKAAYYWGDKVGGLPDYYNILGNHLLESYFAWNDPRYRRFIIGGLLGKSKKNR